MTNRQRTIAPETGHQNISRLAEDFAVISLHTPEPPRHDPDHDRRPPPMPPPSIDDVPLIIPPQEDPPILPPDDDPGPVHEPPARKH